MNEYSSDCGQGTEDGVSQTPVPAAIYFSRISFLTDLTPAIPRASSAARLMSACELTKPLNCTMPLKVSTLISADFRVGSLKIAALVDVISKTA